MPDTSSDLIAVLSGDLVKSTEMDAATIDGVREVISAAVAEAVQWPLPYVVGPEFYRGDAWQLAVTEPFCFLRLATWIKAHLAASESRARTRIAIGLGAVEALNKRAVSRSLGEAFVLSGRLLESMGRAQDMDVALPAQLRHLDWLTAVVSSCDFIVSRWTRSQAEVAKMFLAPDAPSQLEAAIALNRHRQAVNRVYRDAGVFALLELITSVERALLLPHQRAGSGKEATK
ncbi:hypothetical protein C1922_11015 [Stenotrophomonas sp. ZAC14D2_NAIMI4_7]|uniref:hypothetical protein n=1 Tax=Stenotrophomonas sp. ZAC14D2_NAIMI4_7 TaxID=2072405 RepID=UPI000D53DC7B|nr:hypothetical protein [Stenotrophomonas sp. ZAC14D2_NAIMI4_7]AWH17792.1 hypothetical protein C1922_11015 [Stenotrophomonas sp. ZAC14D2_NAIMI4_7]